MNKTCSKKQKPRVPKLHFHKATKQGYVRLPGEATARRPRKKYTQEDLRR